MRATEAMDPTKTHENQNFQHQKETTRVLHPAPRLTPENGGIPPFLRVILIPQKRPLFSQNLP